MCCDIVFVCQAGELAQQSILLAKSIRQFGGKIARAHLHAIIPIPEAIYGSVDPKILKFLEELGVKFYHFRNPIDDAYKHANKLNAFNIDYRTDNIVFLDSDMLVINDFSDVLEKKTVDILVRPTTAMHWPPRKYGESLWEDLYREFNLDLPSRKVIASETQREMLPYFNAGVIICSSRVNFSQFWIRVCQTFYHKDIPRKYPFVDQISLPVAMSLARLSWDTLDTNNNFGLAIWLAKRKLRLFLRRFDWFTLPPTLSNVRIVHYQSFRILEYAAKQDHEFGLKFNELCQELPFRRGEFAVPMRSSIMRRISNSKAFWTKTWHAS